MTNAALQSKKLTHVDLFAGPGGIATGFQAAGFSSTIAVEYVETCVETYVANHPSTPVIHKDVREVTARDLKGNGIHSADVVTAGIPCETFSTAGSSSRSFYDDRQVLFREAIRIADLVQAKVLLLENVPGLLTKTLKKGSKDLVIDQIEKELALAGFDTVQRMVLNAADYGVPQRRERLFVVATRGGRGILVPKVAPKKILVREAFADLPVARSADSEDDGVAYLGKTNAYTRVMRDSSFWNTSIQARPMLTYHQSPRHRAATIERFGLLEPGEGLKDLFEKYSPKEVRELQKRRVLPKKWYIQRNRRLVSSSQSPTVTSHCLDELVHPLRDRALTVREVARLQSFPDWYQFVGGPTICPHNDFRQDKYEQIGDAVPPLLARAVADSIREFLTGSEFFE